MKIVTTLIQKIKNFDEKTKELMEKGYFFSFLLCLFSGFILFIYETIYHNPSLFYIGISLFRTSLMFACTFLICAIGFDTIKKQMI